MTERNHFKPIVPGDRIPGSRLTVVRLSTSPRLPGKLYWDCLCDCGNTHTVYDYSLKCGNVRSCGCLRRESMARVGRGELAQR